MCNWSYFPDPVFVYDQLVRFYCLDPDDHLAFYDWFDLDN